MFFRKKSKPANFAGWAFIDLVALFSALTYFRPVVGLTGLGSVLILAAILVEANKDTIWQNYKKQYKKSRYPVVDFFNRPTDFYYKLNVYIIWPLALTLGLLAIYAAYMVG